MDVLVDNTPRARIRPGQSIPIFLPPYRAYSVRLAPVNGRGGRFDANAREISLYRGNVQFLEWEVRAVQAVFGRLVDADGRPLGGVALYGERDFIQSDASGYFQAEIAGSETFTLRKGGAEICRITLTPTGGEVPILDLGNVVCMSRPAASTENP
jgi:outer membrane usher protein FimD/PapC